jgi:hypothetical protein
MVGFPYFSGTLTVPAFNQFSRCNFTHVFFLLMSDFFYYLLEIMEIMGAVLRWICMKWFIFHRCPGEVYLEVIDIVLSIGDKLVDPVRHPHKVFCLTGTRFRCPLPVEMPDSLPEFFRNPCDLGIPVHHHTGDAVDRPEFLGCRNPGGASCIICRTHHILLLHYLDYYRIPEPAENPVVWILPHDPR